MLLLVTYGPVTDPIWKLRTRTGIILFSVGFVEGIRSFV